MKNPHGFLLPEQAAILDSAMDRPGKETQFKLGALCHIVLQLNNQLGVQRAEICKLENNQYSQEKAYAELKRVLAATEHRYEVVAKELRRREQEMERQTTHCVNASKILESPEEPAAPEPEPEPEPESCRECGDVACECENLDLCPFCGYIECVCPVVRSPKDLGLQF